MTIDCRYPGLSKLLDEVYPLTGVETLVKTLDGVEIYVDPYGSVRFRLVLDGVPVAGLQVVVRKDAVIAANAYTASECRRRGYATRLLRAAVTFIGRDITMSPHRSDDGKLFVASVHTRALNKVKHMPTAPFKKAKAIDEDVLCVLRKMVWTADDRCVIPEQCAIYPRVKKVLEALGGKWNRSAKAIIFTDGGQDRVTDSIMTGTYLDAKQAWQFYETPADVANDMAMRIFHHFGEARGLRVLEPSAGDGAIVDACLAVGFDVGAFEMDESHLVQLQSLQGSATAAGRKCDVRIADFLQQRPPATLFDAVAMNPPFTGLADIAHVTHALDFVKPGGMLVAITSSSWTFRQDKRCKVFIDLIQSQQMYSSLQLPPGTFSASGTNVSAVMLTVVRGLL